MVVTITIAVIIDALLANPCALASAHFPFGACTLQCHSVRLSTTGVALWPQMARRAQKMTAACDCTLFVVEVKKHCDVRHCVPKG